MKELDVFELGLYIFKRSVSRIGLTHKPCLWRPLKKSIFAFRQK